MRTKKLIRALAAMAATVAAPAGAQLPLVQVLETSTAFHLSGDFDGNGQYDAALVDRASGALRMGIQTAPGIFVWGEPVATGVENISGATTGRLITSTRDAIAVASPLANRVHFLDLAAALPESLPVDVPGGIGPLAVVAGQIAGTSGLDDLLLSTALNDGPMVSQLGRYTNDPYATLTLHGASFGSTGLFASAARVMLKTSLGATAAVLERDGTSATLRVFSLEEAGAPERLTVGGLPDDARYLLVPFAGSAYGTLLTWIPGDSIISPWMITEAPPGAYTASPLAPQSAPVPLGLVAAVKGGGVVRLALLSSDGDQLEILDFDGFNFGSTVQTVFPDSAGLRLAAILPLGDSESFIVAQSAGPDGSPLMARHHGWDGTSFAAGAADVFGETGPRAGTANVSFMTGEPFVDTTARPVSLRGVRDWTSGPPPPIPGPVTVTAEIFQSPASGLGDPLPLAMGGSPAGANFVLLNQYADPISVFTLTRASGALAGQVGITPSPGLYDRAVELSFSPQPAALTVYFRDAGGTWQIYTDPGTEPDPSNPGYGAWFAQFAALVRFADTTIEYFGEDGSGRRTPVRRATYTFTAPAETLSSLGDGVPDYVKMGLGVNPFRLPEGDPAAGIGNALQKVLDGSGIDPRWLSGSALDLYIRPLSHDGSSFPSTASRLATDPAEILPDGNAWHGNQIFIHDLSGSIMAQGVDPLATTPAQNEGLGVYPPFSQPSAYISSLSGTDTSVFIMGTRASFALAGTLPPPSASSSAGRELVGLLPIPATPFATFTRTYTGGSHAAEATAWVSGATAFHGVQPPPVAAESLSSVDTAAVLAFERWLQLRFLERGLLPPSYTPPAANVSSPPPVNPDYLTLTSFRGGEAAGLMGIDTGGPLAPDQASLRELEKWRPGLPAHDVSIAANAIRTLIRTSPAAHMVALRSLCLDIFRISAANGNTHPGAFDPPIDVLRRFFSTGALPEPYTAAFTGLPGAPYTVLTATDYTNALNGFALAVAEPQPRAEAWRQVELRADSLSYPGCLVVNEAGMPSVLYSLFNPDGSAFRLPASFAMQAGTRMAVHVFTDAPFIPCLGTPLEVIEVDGVPSAEITLLPAGSGSDADASLLGDEWELAFFGNIGIDPWFDAGGDGYTYLQKYLDGRDPFNPLSYATNPPVSLSLPVLNIDTSTPGLMVVSFAFPEPYAGMLLFELHEAPAPTGPWTATALPVTNPSPGEFEVTIPFAVPANFWRITMSLP